MIVIRSMWFYLNMEDNIKWVFLHFEVTNLKNFGGIYNNLPISFWRSHLLNRLLECFCSGVSLCCLLFRDSCFITLRPERLFWLWSEQWWALLIGWVGGARLVTIRGSLKFCCTTTVVLFHKLIFLDIWATILNFLYAGITKVFAAHLAFSRLEMLLALCLTVNQDLVW